VHVFLACCASGVFMAGDGKRLCARLSRDRAEVTRFLWDEKLDGTHNAAERALRPAMIMRKITGGIRIYKPVMDDVPYRFFETM
jgi:hypothetical protein